MTVTAFGNLHTNKYIDVELNSTAEVITTTNGTKLFGLEVDNSQNSSAVYVKIKNADTYSVGTDAPEHVYKIRKGAKRSIPMLTTGDGHAFSAGICIACTTTGGTAGNTSPAKQVKATLVTS